MKSDFKIAFLTSTDPNDKKSWSGTHFSMYNSLKKHHKEVISLGPIDNVLLKSLGVINKITRFLFGKGYNHHNSILRGKLLSYSINKKLKKESFDFIFAPAASTEIAFLKTEIPIVYLSDSSFGQLNNYYDVFNDLFKISTKESNYIEQKAIDNASFLIYPSKWALDYVIDNYHVNPEKTKIINFGANIDDATFIYQPKKHNTNKESFKILFLGVNWFRKGGNIVYETFKILLEKNYNIELIVCGCIPPFQHEKMKVYPFLNKNDAIDLEKLKNIINDSNILFVPTRADCSPIVFCEANMFGLPVITTDTGGVSSIVENGKNGYCLSYESGPLDYANLISNLIDDNTTYLNLSAFSRQRYEEQLNWDYWANEMNSVFLKKKSFQ